MLHQYLGGYTKNRHVLVVVDLSTYLNYQLPRRELESWSPSVVAAAAAAAAVGPCPSFVAVGQSPLYLVRQQDLPHFPEIPHMFVCTYSKL